MTNEGAGNSRLKLQIKTAGLVIIALLVALVAIATALPRPAQAQNESQATYETVLFEGLLQPAEVNQWCYGYFLHTVETNDERGDWFTGTADSTVPVDGSPVIRDQGEALEFNMFCNDSGRSKTYIRFMPENPTGYDDYGDRLLPGRYVMELDDTQLTFDGVDDYVETPEFPFPPRSYTVLGTSLDWHNRQEDDDLVKVRFTVVRQDHDRDDDGLIEVSNMGQLNAIRFDMDGNGVPESEETRYHRAFPEALPGMGCPDTGCKGYELTEDLDHDTNGNGTFDQGDWPYDDGQGWRPIGFHNDGAYTGEFHGNGHTISNLHVNRDGTRAGLFGLISGSAYVHHVGLPEANVTATGKDVGALVGFIRGKKAAVAGSYATGSVTGGKHTGGLVGSAQGYVVNAWTDVTVNGARHVGGVVGHNGGSVHGVYALGAVTGDTRVHGVVGWTEGGHLGPVYFNSDNHTAVRDDIYSKTTAELQAPTGYTGIYSEWNLDSDRTDNTGFKRQGDPWDFGGSSDYPQLRAFQQSAAPADLVGGL